MNAYYFIGAVILWFACGLLAHAICKTFQNDGNAVVPTLAVLLGPISLAAEIFLHMCLRVK